MAANSPDVIIVGAGIIGLILGQALKKADIPFVILERDENASARIQGWALTLHWGLEYLKELLPVENLDAVKECQVDPNFAANDTGKFLFLNLEDGTTKFEIPVRERWRVNRDKLRRAL
ncbi:hypothetical protein AAFC00_003930 [Neodothiora populina]|uniref:FAD-binding domain-containing protein n=1 Tax=Neodothiora populina TaxID=2781224 RepID=A0ABR3PH16_9PEZI